MRVWGSSVISDTLAISIINILPSISNIDTYLQKAVTHIMELEVAVSPLDFLSRFKELPLEPVLPITRTLPEMVQFYFDTPSFKSIFLGGEGGTGKSMIMTYAALFARQQGWITVNLTNGYDLLHEHKATFNRCYNGLYLFQ